MPDTGYLSIFRVSKKSVPEIAIFRIVEAGKLQVVRPPSPKPILGAMEGFHKKFNFEKFSGVSKGSTHQSSLAARGHMGESDWGYLELEPGTPAMGTGFHVQEKNSSGPRSKDTHSGHNTQRSFAPPQPPTSKKGVSAMQ